MDEVVSKSLLDNVDFTRYVRMDPDLFDFGPLTQYFLRDDEEELFAEAAVQLQRLMRFSVKLQR